MSNKDEIEDIVRNEVDPESLAKKTLYDEFRRQGLSHKEALIKTIDSVGKMKSPDLSNEEMERLRTAILKVPGRFV